MNSLFKKSLRCTTNTLKTTGRSRNWTGKGEKRRRKGQEAEKTVKHLHRLTSHSHFWRSREQDPANIKLFGVLLATGIKHMLSSPSTTQECLEPALTSGGGEQQAIRSVFLEKKNKCGDRRDYLTRGILIQRDRSEQTPRSLSPGGACR